MLIEIEFCLILWFQEYILSSITFQTFWECFNLRYWWLLLQRRRFSY